MKKKIQEPIDYKYRCPDCEYTLEEIKCSKCGKCGSKEDALIQSLIQEPMEVKGDGPPSWLDFVPPVFGFIVIVAVIICVIVG